MAQVQSDEIRANAYVGFETITRQIEHKLLKRGFQFNVIVVGACSSLGVVGAGCIGFQTVPDGCAVGLRRSDWFRKVDVDQHALRVAFS